MFDSKTMTNKERAVKAANERWHPTLPKSTHDGRVKLGGEEFECDVLQDGRRILRKKTLLQAIGKSVKTGGRNIKRAKELNLPLFISASNLTPYLTDSFLERATPILYRGRNNNRLIGFDASLLPEICKVYVQAEHDGILKDSPHQLKISSVCRILLYGLATVGISALIDSATGYESVRARNELELILEKYISEELREWTKKFPNEFFKQIYRLHGWEYPKIQKNHPQYVGKIINKYVYERLPPGVLEQLKKSNPIHNNGSRKFRHHQFLSEEIGDKNLQGQIQQVVTLMRVSKNIDEFKELMGRTEFIEVE